MTPEQRQMKYDWRVEQWKQRPQFRSLIRQAQITYSFSQMTRAEEKIKNQCGKNAFTSDDAFDPGFKIE